MPKKKKKKERELPRRGQYSVKGKIVNVDYQPTVNSLPRKMDENITVSVKLKKKLSRKCTTNKGTDNIAFVNKQPRLL